MSNIVTSEVFDRVIVAEVNLSPVQSVNGQVGFVNITPSGLGLGNVNNTSDLNKPISSAAQVVFDDLFDALGNINTSVNAIESSVTVNSNIKYRAQLQSGVESIYINYPVLLVERPKTIHCEIENDTDNVIYMHKVSNISNSGFNVSFSDTLSNTGYFLNVQIGK